MAIFVGLDVHRAQITYDALDTDTGEVRTGRIRPANRGTVCAFLTRLAAKKTVVAVEAMTGWRFISGGCVRAGIDVRLAEPAEARSGQDRKRRAKTDKLDARALRELLMQERLPESWIAPEHILDLRAKVRLRKTLVDQRTEWLQRIHAVLSHHGVPVQPGASPAWTPGTRASSSLATRGACRPPSRRCAVPAWTSPCTSPIRAAAAAISPDRAHRCCAGPLLRPRQSTARPSSPDHDYYL
jgi:Transposase